MPGFTSERGVTRNTFVRFSGDNLDGDDELDGEDWDDDEWDEDDEDDRDGFDPDDEPDLWMGDEEDEF